LGHYNARGRILASLGLSLGLGFAHQRCFQPAASHKGTIGRFPAPFGDFRLSIGNRARAIAGLFYPGNISGGRYSTIAQSTTCSCAPSTRNDLRVHTAVPPKNRIRCN